MGYSTECQSIDDWKISKLIMGIISELRKNDWHEQYKSIRL